MAVITHDTDFYTWTKEQANLLRNGQWMELDIANLIDEVEDMGLSQYRALESRLVVLLIHLLKWRYEPARQGNSWRLTIKEQRQKSRRVLKKNPGLNASVGEIIQDSYADARLGAARETGLDEAIFPLECQWSLDQVFDDDFWPKA